MNTLKCGHFVHCNDYRIRNNKSNLVNRNTSRFCINPIYLLHSLGLTGRLHLYSTSNGKPVPVKKYINADTDKLDIIKDNENKAGVYR